MDICPMCKKRTYNLTESFGGFMTMRCSNCGFISSARNQKEFDLDVSKFSKRRK